MLNTLYTFEIFDLTNNLQILSGVCAFYFIFFFFRSVNNFEQEMLGLNHRGLHVSSGTRYVIFKSQLMYYKVFRYDSDKNLCFISKTNQTPNVLSNQNESTRVHLIRTWSGHLFFFCPDYFFFDTRHTRMGNKSVLSVLIFCWIFSFIPAENITGKMY